jgi:hypothetical protein
MLSARRCRVIVTNASDCPEVCATLLMETRAMNATARWVATTTAGARCKGRPAAGSMRCVAHSARRETRR